MCVLLVHLVDCFVRDAFVRVSICPFSLPLGVGGWLRFVSVALPGLSVNFLFQYPPPRMGPESIGLNFGSLYTDENETLSESIKMVYGPVSRLYIQQQKTK